MEINLSIITAVYNRADMISNAIESVLNHWVEGMEHIIIDGGSTDGTQEVLKKYPHLKVISEPDNGIYDAWNKGVQNASGKYITFLNSDDKWCDTNIQPILNCLITHSREILIGNAVVVSSKMQQDQSIKYLALDGNELMKNLFNRPPAINAWIIPKKTIQQYKGFNYKYKIAADVDFCLRAIINHEVILTIDVDFYQYIQHPDSLTLGQTRKAKFNYQFENMLVAIDQINQKNIEMVQLKALKRWLNVTCYNLLVNSIILKKTFPIKSKIFITGVRNNPFFLITFIFYSIQYFIRKNSLWKGGSQI